MAVYVDPIVEYERAQVKPEARKYGTKWCHMIADTPKELRAMASDIGLRVEWHQDSAKRPALHHYDLTPPKRARAVAHGAIELSHEEFGRKMAGRVQGEIVAASSEQPIGWDRQQ